MQDVSIDMSSTMGNGMSQGSWTGQGNNYQGSGQMKPWASDNMSGQSVSNDWPNFSSGIVNGK